MAHFISISIKNWFPSSFFLRKYKLLLLFWSLSKKQDPITQARTEQAAARRISTKCTVTSMWKCWMQSLTHSMLSTPSISSTSMNGTTTLKYLYRALSATRGSKHWSKRTRQMKMFLCMVRKNKKEITNEEIQYKFFVCFIGPIFNAAK